MTETNAERLEEIKKRIRLNSSFMLALVGKGGRAGLQMKSALTDLYWLIEQAQANQVSIVKSKKGIPTVIEYKGDRYIFDSPTAYRGGAKRAKAIKT